jgi:hypothetical protein
MSRISEFSTLNRWCQWLISQTYLCKRHLPVLFLNIALTSVCQLVFWICLYLSLIGLLAEPHVVTLSLTSRISEWSTLNCWCQSTYLSNVSLQTVSPKSISEHNSDKRKSARILNMSICISDWVVGGASRHHIISDITYLRMINSKTGDVRALISQMYLCKRYLPEICLNITPTSVCQLVFWICQYVSLIGLLAEPHAITLSLISRISEWSTLKLVMSEHLSLKCISANGISQKYVWT